MSPLRGPAAFFSSAIREAGRFAKAFRIRWIRPWRKAPGHGTSATMIECFRSGNLCKSTLNQLDKIDMVSCRVEVGHSRSPRDGYLPFRQRGQFCIRDRQLFLSTFSKRQQVTTCALGSRADGIGGELRRTFRLGVAEDFGLSNPESSPFGSAYGILFYSAPAGKKGDISGNYECPGHHLGMDVAPEEVGTRGSGCGEGIYHRFYTGYGLTRK